MKRTILMLFIFLFLSVPSQAAHRVVISGVVDVDPKTQEVFLVTTKQLPNGEKKEVTFQLQSGEFIFPFLVFWGHQVVIEGEPTFSYSQSDKYASGTVRVHDLWQVRPFDVQMARFTAPSSEKINRELSLIKDAIQKNKGIVKKNIDELRRYNVDVRYAMIEGYAYDAFLLLASFGAIKYVDKLPKLFASMTQLVDFIAERTILAAPIYGAAYRFYSASAEELAEWERIDKARALDPRVPLHVEERIIALLFPMMQKLNRIISTKEYIHLERLFQSINDKENQTLLGWTEDLLQISQRVHLILETEYEKRIDNAVWKQSSLSSYLKCWFNVFHAGGPRGYQTEYYQTLSDRMLMRTNMALVDIKLHQFRRVMYRSHLPAAEALPQVEHTDPFEIEYRAAEVWMDAFHKEESWCERHSCWHLNHE